MMMNILVNDELFACNYIKFLVQENTNHEASFRTAEHLKELAYLRWRKRGLKADNVSVIVCEFEQSEDDEVVMAESCSSMFQCMSVDRERPCKAKRKERNSAATNGEPEQKQSRQESIGCFIEGTCDECLAPQGYASDTE